MIKKNLNNKKKSSSHGYDIPDELETFDLNDMDEARSYVLYGRSSTGKTTLAMSWPGKILLLDVRDRGTDSVSDVPPKKGVGYKINDWEDFEMVYYFIKKNPNKYKTIVIDTMSQLQQLCVKKVLEDQGKSTKDAGNWGSMRKQDWGQVASIMKEWIINYRDLVDLGIEVVFIAQDRTFNIDEEEASDSSLAPEIGPAMSPSISKHLNAAVNIIGNTFIREKLRIKEVNGKKKEIPEMQYCLRIGPNATYITKARKPKGIPLPSVIVDPDYDKIINIIKGE